MEPDDPVRQNLVNATPPWLISLLLHMGLLLVMGLILLPTVAPKALQISAQFADDFGDQLEEDSIRVALDDEESLEQVLTPDDLPEVEQPLVAPAEVQLDPLGLNSTSELIAPHIGVALTGREPGMKKALLAAYGGNAMTEEAVTMGLEWLKKNQLPDGSWSLAGPYADGGYNENPTAATAMALLAFLGAGNTHKAGNFKAVVKRGSDALLKMQKKDGDFFKGNVAHHRLYSQAQAMIAICELYGMTKDSRLREPAQLSVDYAVKTQDSLGGWRYRPGFDSDTSVTGWFVMGLQSAMMAGLEVPSETLERISGYLDRVVAADGARYGYQPGNDATYPMTAEALLCRQYLGWKKDDPRLQNGVEIIGDEPMNMQQRNVYYWYYATQVLHHMGGDAWDNWNRVMRKELPATQTRAGAERGSWSPIDDQWGTHGGRLYVTCLSLYMLEVYYRHLPIYQ
ncbi:MAG: terpene cyclase/mutase family protein [Planctomycetaceae bacterium]|nr:terpene cyclase/mutase family protein [Planctomycetaceae bacterium]